MNSWQAFEQRGEVKGAEFGQFLLTATVTILMSMRLMSNFRNCFQHKQKFVCFRLIPVFQIFFLKNLLSY